MERLAPDYQRSTVGVPTFLLGGAALSGVASVLQGVLVEAVHNRLLLLIVAGSFTALALGGFWCILKAAAIARRRTRIALDQPLRALWETIGAAGHPPRDQSRQFRGVRRCPAARRVHCRTRLRSRSRSPGDRTEESGAAPRVARRGQERMRCPSRYDRSASSVPGTHRVSSSRIGPMSVGVEKPGSQSS